MKIYIPIIFFTLVSCSNEAINKEEPVNDYYHNNANSRDIDISRNKSYVVKGAEYKTFNSAVDFQQVGIASWYGPGFHGKRTANGEVYNMNEMTAAHKTLPLGTFVEVTNLENKKKIIVRINDRGPFHKGRIIDLSKKAAKELGIIKQGQAKVHIKAIKYE